jgi:N-carbamoyl-L-amino-acid hydrolase
VPLSQGLDVHIDQDRLWSSLDEMASIGATPEGGSNRVAVTEADAAGRERLVGWLEQIECVVRTDAIGNLFARREGGDRSRRPVMFGSHLDTQPHGGRFDGVLGVLAGVELLRTVYDAGINTDAPLELVVWTDEEGARFDRSCIGSSVWSGDLSPDEAYALADRDGVTLRSALDLLGWTGSSPVPGESPDSYFELHIEQGPQLAREGIAVGIVEHIPGIRWLSVELHGETAHSGSTRADERADALVAAARTILEVERIAASHSEARSATCAITAHPNAGSVIVGDTLLLADLRHPDPVTLDGMEASLRQFVAELEPVRGHIEPSWSMPSFRFDAQCLVLLDQVTAARGISAKRMFSGPGHDAGYVSTRCPSAMIFVPCRDGLSHHPDEYVTSEQAAAGATVLLDAVLARANTPR